MRRGAGQTGRKIQARNDKWWHNLIEAAREGEAHRTEGEGGA